MSEIKKISLNELRKLKEERIAVRVFGSQKTFEKTVYKYLIYLRKNGFSAEMKAYNTLYLEGGNKLLFTRNIENFDYQFSIIF